MEWCRKPSGVCHSPDRVSVQANLSRVSAHPGTHGHLRRKELAPSSCRNCRSGARTLPARCQAATQRSPGSGSPESGGRGHSGVGLPGPRPALHPREMLATLTHLRRRWTLSEPRAVQPGPPETGRPAGEARVDQKEKKERDAGHGAGRELRYPDCASELRLGLRGAVGRRGRLCSPSRGSGSCAWSMGRPAWLPTQAQPESVALLSRAPLYTPAASPFPSRAA